MRLLRMGHPSGIGRLRKAVRALRECPHLKIEIWGTRFCGFNPDMGHPPKNEMRGSLHCAVHDETMNRFGRDDEILGCGREDGSRVTRIPYPSQKARRMGSRQRR